MTFDLHNRSLYLCTPDRPDLEQFLSACIAGGVDVVQLRDKQLDARPLLERAALARKVCADYGVPFILNDRPDLALEAGADGVHVGQDDAPVSLARRILGPDKIIGLSTHRPQEFKEGLFEPVNYLSAGPVSETPTKPGRQGTGLGYIAEASELARGIHRQPVPFPFFVTGGVTPETVPAIAAAGASHFVVVRYLTESEDPRTAAKMLSEAIRRAVAGE